MQRIKNMPSLKTTHSFYLGSISIAASLLLAGCGGDDSSSGFTTPLVVKDAAKTCAALQSAQIDAARIAEPTQGAVVTKATYRAAVSAAPNAAGTAMVAATPDYCELLIDIRPVDTTAPLIKSQVNLPVSWNGKSVQMGGGGLNGTLVTGLGPGRADGPETPLPLTRGYMTLGTDSGHQVSADVDAGAFALNDEALTNYAYAAYKKTRDVGVQLSERFYGHRALKAYYIGGSEGGREGMLMAQRYPADFDGIVVIDPVIRLMGLWQFQLSMGQVQSQPGAWLGGKVQLLHDTVRKACDAIDGIEDQVVSNYKACRPLAEAAIASLRCSSGNDEGNSCFSDAQLATLRWTYGGQRYPFTLANQLQSYPGYLYGSEAVDGAFERWVTGTVAPGTNPDAVGGGRSYSVGGSLVRYFVTKDAKYNPLDFKAEDHKARLQQLSQWMDMTDPDLSAFHARGGKLIMRENLSDKGNSPQTGIDYYDSVVAKMGQEKVDQFFMAYAVPGLPHTSAGLPAGSANAPTYGTPGAIDFIGLLDDWVEKDKRPANDLLLTSRKPLPPFDLVSSKPMCRFGSYPHYIGSTPQGGALATNYACRPM